MSIDDTRSIHSVSHPTETYELTGFLIIHAPDGEIKKVHCKILEGSWESVAERLDKMRFNGTAFVELKKRIVTLDSVSETITEQSVNNFIKNYIPRELSSTSVTSSVRPKLRTPSEIVLPAAIVAREAFVDEDPLLLHIARLRIRYGADWESHLSETTELPAIEVPEGQAVAVCPFVPVEEGSIEPLVILPQDIQNFIVLKAKVYQTSLDKSPQTAIYEPSKPLSQVYLCAKALGQFCGVAGSFHSDELGQTFELLGAHQSMTLYHMNLALTDFPFLEEEDRAELSEAVQLANLCENKLEDHSAAIFERIQEGKITMIPLSFFDNECALGHTITLLFYKDHFVICNRGNRLIPETVKMFRYDSQKMTPELVKFLLLESRKQTKLPYEVHQHLLVYEILPQILEADAVKMPTSSYQVIPAKDQTVGNCSKASPMTAVKAAVYLKELERVSQAKAARKAKLISSALSYKLRKQVIENARIFIASDQCPADIKVPFLGYVEEAEAKLDKGTLEKAIPESTIKKILQVTKDSTQSGRAISADDDPFLIIISALRKIRPGDVEKGILLIPLNKAKQHEMADRFKDFPQMALNPITPTDERIYTELISHI